MGSPKTKRKSVRRRRRKTQVHPLWAVLVLGLLALGILLPHWLHRSRHDVGAPVPEGYRHFMVDLSHNNPRKVVWDSLKLVLNASGQSSRDLAGARAILPLSYVVMKATEGESHRDRHFPQWWEEAGGAGLARGAYHFFRSSKSAREQARNYIARVTLTHRDLPPVLDIESVHKGCTREELNRKALEWLRLVEEHYGRKPIVYTGDAFAGEWLSADITGNYPLWIARNHTDPPRTPEWKYWQFTDEAVVYGISGRVDLSVIP